MNTQFDYPCEYCEGTVRDRHSAREAFKRRDGFVILENLHLGVCDRCGHRYLTSATLHALADLDRGVRTPDRIASVPVIHPA